MRKVFYSVYVKGSGWTEPQSGIFHEWGQEVFEGNDGNFTGGSIGLVEDVNTGYVHSVSPKKIRFVQPPETRQHSKSAPAWAEPLLAVLQSIDKKLSTL